jgi:spore coat polysaccharide biosynthesis predicted glycosyltransferase SpsG
VIVDSYAFTSDDFERLAIDKTLVVIDELGDRDIPADLVVNNNIYADDIAYPTADAALRGPKYCMLREPFRNPSRPNYYQPPESLLVTVGGADLADSFVDMLRETASVVRDSTINAVVGPYFSPPDDAPESVVFHREPSNIHTLMWEADMAVSGGGQTLYELAACGTPTVALTLGPDQVRNIQGFERAGFCLAAGEPAHPGFGDTLRSHLETLRRDVKTRRRMSEVGMSLVDGNGVFRVADNVVGLL